MKYVVLLESQAEKELLSLPKTALKRIDARLQTLSQNSHPTGAIKLRGKEGEGWRITAGDYRILYHIDEKQNIIRIYRIKHRRDVYR